MSVSVSVGRSSRKPLSEKNQNRKSWLQIEEVRLIGGLVSTSINNEPDPESGHRKGQWMRWHDPYCWLELSVVVWLWSTARACGVAPGPLLVCVCLVSVRGWHGGCENLDGWGVIYFGCQRSTLSLNIMLLYKLLGTLPIYVHVHVDIILFQANQINAYAHANFIPPTRNHCHIWQHLQTMSL